MFIQYVLAGGSEYLISGPLMSLFVQDSSAQHEWTQDHHDRARPERRSRLPEVHFEDLQEGIAFHSKRSLAYD